MDTGQILNYTITLLALIASLLAWIAKIRWSKEFREAKEAEIKAKVAQMDTIREKAALYESIISNKLIDYSKKTIAELEHLLNETEKSKKEEIKKILNKIRESEKALQQKYSDSEDTPIDVIISHELRTPINSIVGFSNLITTDNIDIKDKKEYCEIIEQNAAQIVNVINDIMELIKTLQKTSSGTD
jgi:signal transduction histidine kinase